MQPTTPIEPEGTFDGLQPGAILFGAFVDVLATIVGTTLLVAFLGPEWMEEAAPAEAVERLHESQAFVVGTLVIGGLCTMLGAFVGARRAGELHVRHGGWIAVTSAALSLGMMLLFPGEPAGPEYPFWAEALGWLLILPAGVAGGALAAALAPDRAPRD